MKIATIIGARPQFVKASTISRVMAAQSGMREVIIHTGQHFDRDMSDVFFTQMTIPDPAYNLGVSGGLHGAMTGRQLERIEEVLVAETPDWVLVYGDTNSTLAGALAAAKLQIPVAHVEAGLRSFNRRMPEEINRVLVDHISALLFAPTHTARENLLAEGIDQSSIHVVGDVMYDAARYYKKRAAKPAWFDALGVAKYEYVLCTVHRAENADDDAHLRKIMRGVAECGLPVILPLHPRTSGRLDSMELDLANNIRITKPVGYLEMLWLETHCRAIATDSGGVQKEAFFHGKPCVTLRNETEWVELLELGVNKLAGTDPARIANLINTMARSKPDFSARPYGTADAAAQILDTIVSSVPPAGSQTNRKRAGL